MGANEDICIENKFFTFAKCGLGEVALAKGFSVLGTLALKRQGQRW